MRGSRVLRWIRRAILLLLVVGAGVAAALYLLASWVPAQYRPANLSWQERSAAAKEFLNKKCIEGFTNKAPVRQPFSISVSQDQVNQYLASMDEIEGVIPDGRPGEARSRLQGAGLADPAVAIGDGVLTLMVRLTEYGKILSADVSFEFQSDGRLRVRLRGVRLGRLAVPESLYRGQIQALRQAVGQAARAAEGHGRGHISAEDVSALLATALGAINEEPIPTVLRGYRQRIAGIDLRDRTLTLRFEPTTAAAPEAADPP
jgi:hypothetical protein